MTKANEKHRRMELRKDIGNRIIDPPNPPPYNRGAKYLVAHACFTCNKSFKRSVENKDTKHICPQCAGVAYEMGRNFRAPRKNDKKQWEKVKRLYAAGYRFFGSGTHDGKKLPEKLSDVEQFIKDNKNHPLRVAEPINISELK